MSRAELAEAVNTYLESTLGVTSHLDEGSIKRYEIGKVQWPRQAHRRQAFRAVLEADTDEELGFVPPGAEQKTGTSPARTFRDLGDAAGSEQTLAAGGVAGEVAVVLGQVRGLSGPATVGEADLLYLRATADLLNSWSNAHGGMAMHATVLAQVTHALNLLTADCPPRLYRDRLAAIAQTCVAVGAHLFDGGRHALAGRLLDFATTCAQEAGDWHLRATALAWRARQAVWLGDPDAGLTYAQLGLVRADRLTRTEQAMLHTASAHAHASRGDTAATLSAIRAADETFNHADPDQDRSWTAGYGGAQHHGETGLAVYELAIRGSHLQATTTRLTAAVAGYAAEDRRSRAIAGAKLATLTLHAGDPSQAAVIGLAAARDATHVSSRRLGRAIGDLVTASQLHRDNSDVAGLMEHLNDQSDSGDQRP